MKRWIVIFSVFLLVFASSGLHKRAEASTVVPSADTLLNYDQIEGANNTECCEKTRSQAPTKHSTCAIPDVTANNAIIAPGPDHSIRHRVAGSILPKGQSCGLPRRPPKPPLS